MIRQAWAKLLVSSDVSSTHRNGSTPAGTDETSRASTTHIGSALRPVSRAQRLTPVFGRGISSAAARTSNWAVRAGWSRLALTVNSYVPRHGARRMSGSNASASPPSSSTCRVS